MIRLTKQISAALCVLLLLVGGAASVFAYGTSYTSDYAVTDDADIFNQSDIDTITPALEGAGQETGWQIIVHTSYDGIESDNMASFYNRYFDGESIFEKNSVMLVIDYLSDNRVILTYGDAKQYFSDERIDEIKTRLKPYLQNNEYTQAAVEFANTVEQFYLDGIPDGGSYTNIEEGASEGRSIGEKLLIAIPVSLVIAAIVFGAMILIVRGRYKHNGKSGTYDLNANSEMKLLDKQDVFLHKETTYTTTSTSSSSDSGSRSGGSSHGSSGSF